MQRYELDWGDYGQPYPLARRMVADNNGEWASADDALALEKERDELRAALAVALYAMDRIKKYGDLKIYGLGLNAPYSQLCDAVDTARTLLGKGEKG